MRNIRRTRSLSLLLAGLGLWQLSPSLIAETATPTLSYPQALERAINNNPELKVFAFRDAEQGAQLQAAGLKPALELGLEIENFAGSGEFKSLQAAEITLALSSALELGGKRDARIGFSQSQRDLLSAQKAVQALDVLAEVTRRFVDVLAAQEQLALAQQSTALNRDNLTKINKRASAGSAPQADVNRAQAAAAQAELEESNLQQQLRYYHIALAASWGSRQVDFSEVSGQLFEFGNDVSLDNLYTRLQANPAMAIFTAQERVKDAEIRLAKTEASSALSWSVGVRQFQASDDAALVAGLSMPLFTSKRSSAAQDAAMAARNVVSAEKDHALLQLHQQLFRAYSNRQQAIASVNTLQAVIIPALKSAQQETRRAYRSGAYSYFESMAAQQELLMAQRSLINAAADALRFGAEIEQLTGESLTRDSAPTVIFKD